MVDKMKIVKFEMLIEDIQKAFKTRGGIFSFINTMNIGVIKKDEDTLSNPALALIYDYDKVNTYGKIIMKQSSIYLTKNQNIEDVWTKNYKFTGVSSFKDPKKKLNASKELVRLCILDENRSEAYKFIFWALMILTVDKNDYEERLSAICDFASMLNIIEEEIDDIIHVIKIIYKETDLNIPMKTTSITKVFEPIFNLYK